MYSDIQQLPFAYVSTLFKSSYIFHLDFSRIVPKQIDYEWDKILTYSLSQNLRVEFYSKCLAYIEAEFSQ